MAMEGNSERAAIANGAVNSAAFRLLVSCPSGLDRSQVFVDFKDLYDREPHPDEKLELSIEQNWSIRLSSNPSFFNGSKFRYGGFHMLNDEKDLEYQKKLCIHLGLTDYKTFIGTNLSPKWEQFLVPVEGEKTLTSYPFSQSNSYDVSRCKHLACPLGNGAIIETADAHILLLHRSSNVGEFPNSVVFPGGHSEPDEVGIKSHASMSCTMTKDELNLKIASEMFDGIIREVVEETGVPATTLSQPIFLGVSQRALNVRPAAFFYFRCYLSSEVVFDHYNSAQHGFESTKLFAVSKDDLPNQAKKMPGCHQGGVALYILMCKSTK